MQKNRTKKKSKRCWKQAWGLLRDCNWRHYKWCLKCWLIPELQALSFLPWTRMDVCDLPACTCPPRGCPPRVAGQGRTLRGCDSHEGWPWLHAPCLAAVALIPQKSPQSLLFQTVAVKRHVFSWQRGLLPPFLNSTLVCSCYRDWLLGLLPGTCCSVLLPLLRGLPVSVTVTLGGELETNPGIFCKSYLY